MSTEETIYVDALVLRTTERALLVQVEGEEEWIPKSQICEDSELNEDSEEGDEGMLAVPLWLAQEKNWD